MLLPSFTVLALSLLSLTQDAVSVPISSPHKPHHHRRYDDHPAGHWLAAWTAMPQLTEPANLPAPPFNTTSVIFPNTTLRQTLRVTAATTRIRLRLSNAFGLSALPVTSVTVAKPLRNATSSGAGSPAVDPATLRNLTFGGGASAGFAIPDGALAVTDAVDLPVAAGEVLSVSVYLAGGQAGGAVTSHPGSRTTTWMAFGDLVDAPTLAGADAVQSVAHWYFISTLDAWVEEEESATQSTLALVGDSITDGRGSTTDGNDRWADQLFDRLLAANSTAAAVAIANQAAGGNRVLADGLGPNALGRFDRDVLAQPGVRYALVFEGVNDIGSAAADAATQAAIGDALIAAYQQFVLRAHAAGVPIFGATITPFNAPGYNAALQPYSSAERERTRQRVNKWVRESGWFDAVVDFDEVVRDAANQAQLKAEYDSGDYLHPNVAGYKAMADAFPVGLFEEWKDGVDGWA